MGLNGAGPRDWSPGDSAPSVSAPSVSASSRAHVGSRLPVHSQRAPTASPPHPSVGVTAPFITARAPIRSSSSAPRSGAWAPFVLSLAAMFAAVVEFRDGHSGYFLLTTIGLVAVCGAVVARRKIRSGYRGSLVLTSGAIALGSIATIIMLARFLLIALVPGLESQLPLFLLGSPAISSVAAQQSPIPQATTVAETSLSTLTRELGTVVYLIGQEPAGTDLTTAALVNGVIVFPGGQAIQAPGAKSLHIRAHAIPSDFVVSLSDQYGNRLRYDSAVGAIERVPK